MKIVNQIIEYGATQANNSETVKKIILVNKIALVFIIAAIPFMGSIMITTAYTVAYFVPIVICSFIGTIILNKKSKFMLAKLNLYLTILISVYFYAACLGETSGIQYVYLSLIGFGYGIFDSSQAKLRLGLSILPIACFLTLYFTKFKFFYSVLLSESEISTIYLTSIILIFIIIWLTILFFDQFSTEYKKDLKKILLSYELTDREGEVFVKILNGKSNKSISTELFIEEGTVKNHLTNIYKKLSVRNRNELMAKFTH